MVLFSCSVIYSSVIGSGSVPGSVAGGVLGVGSGSGVGVGAGLGVGIGVALGDGDGVGFGVSCVW